MELQTSQATVSQGPSQRVVQCIYTPLRWGLPAKGRLTSVRPLPLPLYSYKHDISIRKLLNF